jgi:hypothetical protein
MPEPVTVWAVRLGSGRGEKMGTLSLGPVTLSFKHVKGTDDADIALSAIRHVKRGVGSPVLLVEFDREEAPSHMAFFFARPPPIDLEAAGFRRMKDRRQNLKTFLAQNTSMRPLVRQWRRELRAAVRAARR